MPKKVEGTTVQNQVPAWEMSHQDTPPQTILFRYMMRALDILNVKVEDLGILSEKQVKQRGYCSDKEFDKKLLQESGICEGLSQVASAVMASGLCQNWVTFLSVCKRLGGPNPYAEKFTIDELEMFKKYSRVILQCQYGIKISEEDAFIELDKIIKTQHVVRGETRKFIETNIIAALRILQDSGDLYLKARALAFLFNNIELPKTNLILSLPELSVGETLDYFKIANTQEDMECLTRRIEACPYLFSPPNRVILQSPEHLTSILALPIVKLSGMLSYKWLVFTPNFGGNFIATSEKKSSQSSGVFRIFSSMASSLFTGNEQVKVDPLAQGGFRVFDSARDAISALFKELRFNTGSQVYSLSLGGCGPQWGNYLSELNLNGPIPSCNAKSLFLSLIDYVNNIDSQSALKWQSTAQVLKKVLTDKTDITYKDIRLDLATFDSTRFDRLWAQKPYMAIA